MNDTRETSLEAYLRNVANLFNVIESWSIKSGLLVERLPLDLSEADYGVYRTEKLLLIHTGRVVAEIVPVGCAIVGFAGRVDIVGDLDSEVLVYSGDGGPYMTQHEEINGEIIQTRKMHFYRGVKEAGWYWIESTRLGRAKKFDEALFFDLLVSVSEYAAA